jgi:hypothetical protein
LCRDTGVPKNILFDYPELLKSVVPILIKSSHATADEQAGSKDA